MTDEIDDVRPAQSRAFRMLLAGLDGYNDDHRNAAAANLDCVLSELDSAGDLFAVMMVLLCLLLEEIESSGSRERWESDLWGRLNTLAGWDGLRTN